jgi:hypothetical protein
VLPFMVSLSNHERKQNVPPFDKLRANGMGSVEPTRVKRGCDLALSITPFIRCLLLLGAVVSAACGDGSGGMTPAASPAPAAPVVPLQTSATVAPVGNANSVVTVGGASFKVELAVTQEQRTQGLSGRAGLAPGTGMLFVFDEEGRYSFWMKEMRFPLDLVWIGPSSEGCTAVDITANAPPPTTGHPSAEGLAELPLYTPVAPVRYVLEVNGGETEAAGVRVDSRVEFRGSLAGLYGC